MEHKVGSAQGSIHAAVGFKGDETKASGATGGTVQHEGGVQDVAKLRKVVGKLFLGHFGGYTSDKDLLRLFLLFTRDGAFGIDLWEERGRKGGIREC